MQLTTYGLEYEVVTEAPALVRHLYDRGLCGTETMHPWHCGCGVCTDQDYLFHAQTDSSCSGEVITRVLHHDPTHELYDEEVFSVLEEASLLVDAEPGPDAGMHVHVAAPAEVHQPDVLWAFLRYEPLLLRLSGGRWLTNRGSNVTARSQVTWGLEDYYCGDYTETAGLYRAADSGETGGRTLCARRMLAIYREADRHSALNTNTNHGTWEFRLWNSTRAAWRMELWTRLSVALVDPLVVRRMLAAPFPGKGRNDADRLAVLLDGAGHERCAELLDRQATYSWERAHEAPHTLTIF